MNIAANIPPGTKIAFTDNSGLHTGRIAARINADTIIRYSIYVEDNAWAITIVASELVEIL